MLSLKGETITLYSPNFSNKDIFGDYIEDDFEIIKIENVIIAPIENDSTLINNPLFKDILNKGFILGLPKKIKVNDFDFEKCFVKFYNSYYKVVGVVSGMQHAIPLQWHVKLIVDKSYSFKGSKND